MFFEGARMRFQRWGFISEESRFPFSVSFLNAMLKPV
jgi:hypothetical protein